MKALLIYDFEFWMILSNDYLFNSLYFRSAISPFSTKYLLMRSDILFYIFVKRGLIFLSVLFTQSNSYLIDLKINIIYL